MIKKKRNWRELERLARYPRANTPRSCLGGEHTTVPRITIQVRLSHAWIAHTLTAKKWTAWPWHSEAPSVIQRPPARLDHARTPSQRNRWHQHHRPAHTTIPRSTTTTTNANRNTWRRGQREREEEGWGPHRLDGGDGFLNLAIKDPSWPGWMPARHTSKPI